MTSTITDRVSGAVQGARVQRLGFGRIRLIPSSGVDTILCDGSPTVTQWDDYQEFVMRPLGTNTGAVVVTPDDVTGKSLVMPDGATALPAGTLTANQDAQFYYHPGFDKLVLLGPF